MSSILYREAAFTQSEGRTLHGLAVPFGQIAPIREYDPATGEPRDFREQFAEGAFARTIAQRGHKIPLMIQHDARKLPAGKAVRFEETKEGLHAEFRVAETTDGNDLLTLVRDGIVDSFSIGFRLINERWEGDLRTVVEAGLVEVSAVAFPAYEGAKIAGVRARQLTISKAVAERRLQALFL